MVQSATLPGPGSRGSLKGQLGPGPAEIVVRYWWNGVCLAVEWRVSSGGMACLASIGGPLHGPTARPVYRTDRCRVAGEPRRRLAVDDSQGPTIAVLVMTNSACTHHQLSYHALKLC